ncbi:hypothetical protein A4R26_01095 [Niastella populi]|uniref:Uncharacterized protein n=1 Tax=Niastella populi TaxID=550983 RepID=A0A1V9GCM8_9BACT|nr:hypothetical protein A4R26_01095 [Niastella populi]
MIELIKVIKVKATRHKGNTAASEYKIQLQASSCKLQANTKYSHKLQAASFKQYKIQQKAKSLKSKANTAARQHAGVWKPPGRPWPIPH